MPFGSKLTQLRHKLATGPLQRGNFARNVLTVTTGTVVSQGIALAMLPVLTRLYQPSAFGLLAAFLVVSDVASQFACLGYHNAIVIPRRDAAGLSLWAACILISIPISGLALFIITFFAPQIAKLAGNPELTNWLWLIPLSMLIFAVFEATSNWCIRKKQFGEISASMVANRLTKVGSQVALTNLGPRAATSGLLIGHLIGDALGAMLIVWRSVSSIDAHYWRRLRPGRTTRLLKIYRHFPTYGLMSSLVSAVVRALPVLLLGFFFSPAVVGFYALANQMVAGPAQLIAGAIFKVFFERANRAKQEGNLDQMVVRLYSQLCSMLMTPLGLLSIAAPKLTEWILGPGWIQTGTFLRWIAILVFFTATVGPLHRVFQVLGKQRELALLQSLSFAAGTSALAIGGIYGYADATIASYAIVMSSILSLQAARILAISGARTVDAIRLPAREFLCSAPYFTAMAITIYVTEDKLITTAICLGLIGLFVALRFRIFLENHK